MFSVTSSYTIIFMQFCLHSMFNFFLCAYISADVNCFDKNDDLRNFNVKIMEEFGLKMIVLRAILWMAGHVSRKFGLTCLENSLQEKKITFC